LQKNWFVDTFIIISHFGEINYYNFLCENIFFCFFRKLQNVSSSWMKEVF
jgi:hypothetical protein